MWKTMWKTFVREMFCIDGITIDHVIMKLHIKRKEIKWTKTIFRGERGLPNQT